MSARGAIVIGDGAMHLGVDRIRPVSAAAADEPLSPLLCLGHHDHSPVLETLTPVGSLMHLLHDVLNGLGFSMYPWVLMRSGLRQMDPTVLTMTQIRKKKAAIHTDGPSPRDLVHNLVRESYRLEAG